jgi:polysaccharide pyruvyl transferase WcaK-like protein
MYEYFLYKYIYVHPIFISIFKKLCRLDLLIHKVGYQFNNHIKSKI